MRERKFNLQAYDLKPNIKINCFVLDFPDKWIISYRQIKTILGSEKKYIKFSPYEKFLLAKESSILFMQSLDNTWKNSHWLITTQEIALSRIYVYFITSLKTVIDEIRNVENRAIFSNWVDSLSFEDLNSYEMLEIKLTNEDGDILNPIAYQLFPRLIYQEIVKEPLIIENEIYPFFFVEDGIITEPSLLNYKESYYSFKVVASIQTTPSERKPMLLLTYSIRRWMNYKVPTYSWNYSITTIYKKERNHLIRLEAEVKLKEFQWENLTKEFYNVVYEGETLPNANELMLNPKKYLNFFVTHRLEFGKTGTSIGAGESMKDRQFMHDALTKRLNMYLGESPVVRGKVLKVKKMNKKEQRNLIESEKHKETFNILAKAIGQPKLNLEIYYSGKPGILHTVKEQLEKIFGSSEGTIKGDNLDIAISYHLQNELFVGLSTEENPKARHEERIEEIKHLLPNTTNVTACLMLIPYKNEKGESFYNTKEDPKKSIRAGFALKNRLTQFISTSLDDEDSERVKTAIYDLMRQLGYIDSFEEKISKEASYNTAITALHVINKKYTPYGSTKRTLVTVTRLANRGGVMVECPAIWKGAIRYWEACLMFQKIATAEGLRALKYLDLSKEIKHKVYSLVNVKEPHLLLVESNGQTRNVWKMITDGNLSKIDKKENYTLSNLWIDKDDTSIKIEDSSELRIIRIRANNEVPDYLTEANEKGDYKSVSGIFELNRVYYSITNRPKSYSKSYSSNSSKLQKNRVTTDLKFPNILEIYPIHLKKADEPDEWISLVHNYRSAAHQYKDDLKKPLISHLASKLEEYIY